VELYGVALPAGVDTDVVYVNLPAPGYYSVTAEVVVGAAISPSTGHADVLCKIVDGNGGHPPMGVSGSHDWWGTVPGGNAAHTTLTLNAANFTSSGKFILRCSSDVSGTPTPVVSTGQSNIIATPVGNVLQGAPVQ
jgi:hypothetical protein